jgi:hypothetical protein
MTCSTNVNDFFRNFTVVPILNEFVVNEFNIENQLSRPMKGAGFSATHANCHAGSVIQLRFTRRNTNQTKTNQHHNLHGTWRRNVRGEWQNLQEFKQIDDFEKYAT